MKKFLFQTTTLLLFIMLPALTWGQCSGSCPSNDNACSGNCCLATGEDTGAGDVSIDDCLGTAGITIIRITYDATISSGQDASNTLLCLSSNNNVVIADNVSVNNQTCIQVSGNNNDVTITIPGSGTVTFSGSTQINLLNSGLAAIPAGTTLTALDVVNALPVNLISYHGKTTAQGAALNWVTASETDNDYFLLEHSIDGKTFTALHKIFGQGNGLLEQRYNYLDTKAKAGLNYYRLWQFDFDGTKTNLGIVKVSIGGSDLIITPNPVSAGGRIFLGKTSHSEDLSTARCTLINAAGQEWALHLDHQELVLPNQLAKGLYYLRIVQEQGTQVLSLQIF